MPASAGFLNSWMHWRTWTMADNGQRHLARQRALSREVRALYEVPELEPRLERFRAVHDPLDLREELDMARALFEEYLVTYQQQNAWGKAWQQAMVEQTDAP